MPQHGSDTKPLLLQDKPYALFGTCLGGITAYQMTRKAHASGAVPLPVALFEAAVSPPHMYARAVMKLYLQAGEQLDLDLILDKLRGWDTMPREQLMQVC